MNLQVYFYLNNKLKDLVINACWNKTQVYKSEPNENKLAERLLKEICDVKTNVHQMFAVMNYLSEDIAMVNYYYQMSRHYIISSKGVKCYIAVQTELYLANKNTNQTGLGSLDPALTEFDLVRMKSKLNRICTEIADIHTKREELTQKVHCKLDSDAFFIENKQTHSSIQIQALNSDSNLQNCRIDCRICILHMIDNIFLPTTNMPNTMTKSNKTKEAPVVYKMILTSN
jgi:hypothetical protein